jgi:glutamyl-tRNA reductase
MNLRAIGCNVASAPVALRERLAFTPPLLQQALAELTARYGVEAVILGTCNRVELYLARPEVEAPLHAPLLAEFLGEMHGLNAEDILPYLYEHADEQAVRHLFRVACGLDSVVLGEAQITGQVKEAYETARQAGSTGSLLNTLFPAALRVAKRVRTETGIGRGHASVSSAAVDFLLTVFDTFTDKVVLVIGVGKMGRLTLQHIRELRPAAILVTNRHLDKAQRRAAECGGQVVPWDQLDEALIQADIVLSTTGAPEPIVSRRRFEEKVRYQRAGRPLVIFDMAVPRDFDPAIHDGESVILFNVDDLTRVANEALAERRRHIPAAEAIIAQEVHQFVLDWNRRKDGPIIGRLTAEVDRLRETIVGPLLQRFNGKLTEADKAYIEGAFRLFQNRLLHGPIAALQEASRTGQGHSLREAIRKLFGLNDS